MDFPSRSSPIQLSLTLRMCSTIQIQSQNGNHARSSDLKRGEREVKGPENFCDALLPRHVRSERPEGRKNSLVRREAVLAKKFTSELVLSKIALFSGLTRAAALFHRDAIIIEISESTT